MLLENSELEKLAIRTMSSRSSRSAAVLFSHLREDHFNTSMREVYERLLEVARETGKIATWRDLLHDPKLSESVREELSDIKVKPFDSPTRSKKLAKQLNVYRQARSLFELADSIAIELRKDKVNVEKLLNKSTERLTATRTNYSSEDLFTHGDPNDKRSIRLLKSILRGKRLAYIPTGFKGFDDVNKGIIIGSAVLLGATSGGGKTATALQMAINMAKWGARVGFISLEMSAEEMEARLAANISQTSLLKLLDPQNRLDKSERSGIIKKARAFHNELVSRNSILTFYTPEEDISIEELMFTVKPYNYDVIFVDYINLLRDMDGDRQWQLLSSGARFCKRFAHKNKCIVVLLVQISEEGIIRYSKGLKEHASNFWSWVYGEENRESHILPVKQQKARNQKAFDFFLRENFDTMTVTDYDGEPLHKKKSKKLKDYDGDDYYNS